MKERREEECGGEERGGEESSLKRRKGADWERNAGRSGEEV